MRCATRRSQFRRLHRSPGRRERAWTLSAAPLKPLRERLLTLTRRLPSDQCFDADVLVKFGPVDSLTTPDESPLLAFFLRSMHQAWVPGERHGNRASITEIDY